MFKQIASEDLRNALRQTSRQYLAGTLQRPQLVEAFVDSRIEVGISEYAQSASEKTHFHTQATEYQFIVSGLTEYLDIDTGETHIFRSGDAYAIEPLTKYAQRIKAGTTILFVKVPAGDDKVVVEESPETILWRSEPLRVTRLDVKAGGKKHIANTLKPAAAVAVVEEDSVLLVKRRDSGMWTMPGGVVEMSESLPEAAVREVFEETGLRIQLTGIVGTYTDPANLIVYSDGEVRREFTIVFVGHTVSGELQQDDESTEVRWVRLRDWTNLPMARSQTVRLHDVAEYLATKSVCLR